MTKSELVEAIAARAKLTKTRAEHVVGLVFDVMARSLEQGDHIEVRGFGSFTVRSYDGYPGRNPKTGGAVAVSPKRLPFFKVGKELKELVNESRAYRPSVSGGDNHGSNGGLRQPGPGVAAATSPGARRAGGVDNSRKEGDELAE